MMNPEQYKSIVERLRNDEDYYGDFGKQFFSNSEIAQLIDTPDLYGKQTEVTLDMLKGSYLHRKILEPEKLNDIVIVDADTRNNKAYREVIQFHEKEGKPKPIFLLRKEISALDALADTALKNNEFRRYLLGNAQPGEFEEPNVGEIMGYLFKGKADRVNNFEGVIPDIKTTRNLETFPSSFWKYGYHSQAYIYSHLWGLPVRFFVISKEDGRLGVYDVSDETLEAGRLRVEQGLKRYEMYFGDEATEDVDQYFDYHVF